MREGEYKNGKKHGPWKLYYPNGQLKSEATFHEGLYTGYYCSYHDNGEPRSSRAGTPRYVATPATAAKRASGSSTAATVCPKSG